MPNNIQEMLQYSSSSYLFSLGTGARLRRCLPNTREPEAPLALRHPLEHRTLA